MTTDALFTLAQGLLTSIENIFSAAGVSLPSRKYVSNGDVAFDCEQLAVQASQVYLGQSGGQVITPITKGAAVVRTVEFSIYLLRCAPVAPDNQTAPSAADIQANAQKILIDGWVLFQGVLAEGIAGTLLGECENFSVNAMTPQGPAGGQAGWLLKIAGQI